jgi:hypothetical protein
MGYRFDSTRKINPKFFSIPFFYQFFLQDLVQMSQSTYFKYSHQIEAIINRINQFVWNAIDCESEKNPS